MVAMQVGIGARWHPPIITHATASCHDEDIYCPDSETESALTERLLSAAGVIDEIGSVAALLVHLGCALGR